MKADIIARFLPDRQQATGAPITKLPCGCYAGPCIRCGQHTMNFGLRENSCGDPEKPHYNFIPLAGKLK